MNGTNLYLKPDEAKFLGMAVADTIELLDEQSKNQRINFNPEARKMLKEMLAAGEGLRLKLQKIGIDVSPLPSYNEGDENEFLTKES